MVILQTVHITCLGFEPDIPPTSTELEQFIMNLHTLLTGLHFSVLKYQLLQMACLPVVHRESIKTVCSNLKHTGSQKIRQEQLESKVAESNVNCFKR